MSTMSDHNSHADSEGKTYFDPDGDKDLHESKSSDETADQPLTWRGDPEDTHSDWKINIVTDELDTITYHVHKSVLCFGPRQSKFFAKVMLNHSSKHSNKKKTKSVPSIKVELDQRDAINFPILLDFIYAPSSFLSAACSGTVVTAASTSSTALSLLTVPTEDTDASHIVIEELSTNNAVSLRYLARTFEMDALMMAVNKFIQRDLNFKTGPKYLTQASEYKDERLVESAQRLCAENFEQLDKKALVRLPLQLFRVVVRSLESFEEDNRKLSNFLSEVVCRYLEKHPKILSAGLLLELTDSLVMPYIAPEAAIGFTALVKDLDAEDAQLHWARLVSLSRRCAKAVVQEYGWSDFSVDAAADEYLGNTKESESDHEVSRVDSLLFATSFAAALEQAQDDYEEMQLEQERLQNMVQMLAKTMTLMEKVNDVKDKHLAKQQSAIEEAKKQILNLKQQIGEVKKQQFQRSPHEKPARQQSEMQMISSIKSFGCHSGEAYQMEEDPAVKDLISPSQVGTSVHSNKAQKIKELRTKNEMRSRSLLV